MNGTETLEASEEQPCVTWLLSVKNNFPFLRQTLESIRSQTYRNHKLLVWDDCSNDGTLEELQRWVPALIPGRIFSGRSLRLGPSLAFLVEQADTELCARIDGDDVNFPERLQKQVAFMQAHPEVGLLGSLTEHIDEHGTPSPGWYVPIDDATARWRSRWQTSACHPTVMFRRSAVLAAGNYRDFQIEDLDLWMRMSLITEFRNLPEPLVQYRRYTSSLTGQVDDFFPLYRKTAILNAAILFSNIGDPMKGLDLWNASHPDRMVQIGKSFRLHPIEAYRNIKSLENAAVTFARQVGKPDHYFTDTELFKEQRYWMRRRLFRSCGLGKLYALRPHLALIRRQGKPVNPAVITSQPKSAH